ncbi:hypothetical protein [Nostoc sp. 'Peltigera malacea cyanobiont' DB3992]|uniref:hypothetical protein n=1 Tax=Nostoc sp. 'Peltigera malacea cyanobiont' DB3992 TaxID=1206980 RepID=UPI0026CFCAB4
MMSGYVSGSALPRIILNDFKKMKLIIPPLDILQKFESIVILYMKILGLQMIKI